MDETKREQEKRMERRLTIEERMEALSSMKESTFFEYDIDKDIIWISRDYSLTKKGETRISHFLEKLPRIERVHEDDIEIVSSYLKDEYSEMCQFRYLKDDGTFIWCQAKCACVKDEKGKACTKVGSILDINQEKHMHDMLVEQALLDPLTKMYSKSKAKALIEKFIKCEGSFGKHVLMLINLTSFSEVNKRFGSAFGDTVLINVAEQIKKCFRSKDILARIGGDDFMVLVKDVASSTDIENKMKQILKVVHQAYAGENFTIGCNIGASRFPQDGRNYESLFRGADAALFRAGRHGNTGCEIFDSAYEIDEYYKRGDYYHDYAIDEKLSGAGGDFSQEITNSAVDIMLDCKDVASAIKLLLDKVGKYYKCDNVLILEVDDKNFLHTSYAWDDKDGLNHFNTMQYVDMDELPDFSGYFDERGLRVIENASTLRKHPGYGALMELFEAKSLLQCAFYDEDGIKGCISIGHSKKLHQWLPEEVNALLTITKLVSVYLLKLRNSERIQSKIDNMKNYDGVTKLPSKHKFIQDVNALRSENPDSKYVIVHIDINKFKYINDTMGYHVGDDVLREFARTVSREEFDIVCSARESADNFLLLMNYQNDGQVKYGLERLNEEFIKRVQFESVGKNIFLVSGVAYLEGELSTLAVIDNANLARKNIKQNTEVRCCFYDENLQQKMLLELDICYSMEKALQQNEFLMYLQPKVSLEDNKIVGAEALTRWMRADGEMMYPDQFIPLFEKNGFIVALDFYIYECACQTVKRWESEKVEPVPISVNVSRVHLNHDGFVDKVLQLVDRYKVEHSFIEFELTESIFLDNTSTALDTMRRLREEGFLVAIDDFGAGFSSLNLLKDMTTDVLKLDKEFFSKGEMKPEEKIIVSSITNMAKQLKMKVLSEGVETKAQSDFLHDIACDMAQGYLFAKPMPVDEFTKLLQTKL